jgi:hypothetical protein
MSKGKSGLGKWLALFIIARVGAASGAEVGLTENARAEIAALLKEKASWTAAQNKMDSQLIQASKKHRGQAFAPGAGHLQIDLKLEPDGRVLVDIRARVTTQLLALIQQGGGRVIAQFPQFQAVRALLTLDQVEPVAASPEVIFIRRADQFSTNTGSLDSEGDVTHAAMAARGAFGATGAGVKVGVLSDSVDYYTNSQASGDLGPVTILSGQSGIPATGEGTAMLEIIHDLAPDAQLYFATADGGQAIFAQNIRALQSSGCSVLVDDVEYFAESPFQDGVVAQAVNDVTAAGALYFSSAGNSGNQDSGTAGTWEGDFADGGAVAFPEPGRIHSFGSTNYDTILSGGSMRRMDLFWSDPLGGAANDYDLFLLDASGGTVLYSSITRQNGTQDPYEMISTNAVGWRAVVVKFSGAGRFLHLSTGRSRLAIATAGATKGHSATTNAFSVAAVDSATAYPNSFAGSFANPVETFSSDGLRHVFFNADGSSITPGNYSSSGGAIRQKPDMAAADGVLTTVPGFRPFYGTSAASPHAAAIAALLKSYNPNLTPAEVRSILTSTALDIMGTGVDRNAGFGIVMAPAALQAGAPDSLFITPGTGFTASGLAGGPLTPAAQTFWLTNNGSSMVNWSLVNTSLWLTVSATSGTISPGGPAANVTVALNAGSSNLAAGTYPATIAFTNLNSGVGQSRQFKLLAVTPSGPASLYANTVLSMKPAAYWRLEETNRPPAADVVTNFGTLGAAANGFALARPAQGEPGVVGNSCRFSNASLTITYFGSHADIPYQPVLNPSGPFTVELWAKPAQLTTDLFCPACALDASLNNGNSRSGWIFYQAANNTWQFRLGGLGGYAVTNSGGTVQAQVWHHLTGVYDGANARLYVNGALAAGPTAVSGFNANTNVPLRLGATTIPNRTYDGWVDEAAFFTNALSAGVIAAHYSAATTNPAGYAAQILASHPAGYWRLEEPANVSPAQSALPVAVNLGALAPIGNAIYRPGSLPAVAGAPYPGFGVNNLGCQFNGTGYLDVPAGYFNFTGPLTVLAWVKANSANGSLQSLLNKGAGTYQLFMDGSGHPHFAEGAQPNGGLIGPSRLDDGLWHQWIGVYDATNTEALYIDGQLVASTSSATNPVSNGSNDLWIGGDPDVGAFQLFNGVLDEVALFTNVLTAAQIQQLFSAATNSPGQFGPAFQAMGRTGNTLTLRWTAIAGRTYLLQYKTNLAQANWNNLTTTVATNITVSASDTTAADRQRFYRVVLLP